MEDKNQQGQNMYAIIFTIIAILALIGLVLLLFWRVQADNTNQNVNLTSAPTIDAIAIYTDNGASFDLNADNNFSAAGHTYTQDVALTDSQTSFSLNFTATDANGCTTIDQGAQDAIYPAPGTIDAAGGTNYTYSVYKDTDFCGFGDSGRDNDTCYMPSITMFESFNSPSEVWADGNSCDGPSDDSFSATIHSSESDGDGVPNYAEYQYNTEPGAWTVDLSVIDDSNEITLESLSFDIAAFNSLDVTTDVEYGIQTIGASPASTEQFITFENRSNSIIDASFVAADFIGHGADATQDLECDVPGSLDIPAGFVEIGPTAGFTHEYEDGISNASSTGQSIGYGGTTFDFEASGLARATSATGASTGGDPDALPGVTTPSEYIASLQLYVQDVGLTNQVDGVCKNVIEFTSALHI